MKLRDLDAEFIVRTKKGMRRVETLAAAQGVMFQCPKCAKGLEAGEENGRRFFRGAHYIVCWFRNPQRLAPVADNEIPGPGRWWAEGTSIDDLTFGHGTPPMAKSILLTGGCGWHGFVTNGDAHD